MSALRSAKGVRRRFAGQLAIVCAAVGLLTARASGEPPFETVPGPETPRMLADVAGRFAIDEARSACYPWRTIDASAQGQRCVPRPHDTGWDSAIVPASDRTALRLHVTPTGGSAADGSGALTVALQSVTDCPGGEVRCAVHAETIATWTRTPEGDLYRQSMALSPDGRTVALVPAAHLLKGPGYSPRLPPGARFHGLRYVGELMLVDLQTHEFRDAGIEVVDGEPISWSADGRRLLFVRAEPIEALPAPLAEGIVGDVGHPGPGVPVVEVRDVAGGAITMLAIGLQPLWSPGNRTLLFQPAHDRVATLDLLDHKQGDVVLPGMSTRYEAIVIAYVGPRKVLYWALPTAGADAAFTSGNSPLVGPKQLLSLKVADLDTGAFATVYENLDPRARVGYRAY